MNGTSPKKSITLLSLNIEGTKHYDRFFALIQQELPDVLCLQEVPEDFLPTLHNAGYHTHFLPRCTKTQDNGNTFTDGVVIASKYTFDAKSHMYFSISCPDDVYDEVQGRRRNNHGVIIATLPIAGASYTIATTHFTWTVDGRQASPAQKQDLSAFLAYTPSLPDHILCGDFNIPRAYNELYATLTTVYKDHIPTAYTTSLDPMYHRMRHDPSKFTLLNTFMVDYIFTKGTTYTVTNVRQIFGVSDHAAILADISVR